MKLIKKKIKHNEYVYFTVYVNRKEQKGHYEVYRLPKLAYAQYKKLGYNKAFFDFKPLTKYTPPGRYKVDKISYTNDKAYYHTQRGIFSLPKYLDEKLPSKTHIFYSQRVTSE